MQGQHYNYYNLQPEGPGDSYNIDLQRSEYQRLEMNDANQQVLVTMLGMEQQVHMAIIPYNQHLFIQNTVLSNLSCEYRKKKQEIIEEPF